jgi:hypothetical protein
MLKTFRVVLEFICPIMLGILEMLKKFNSTFKIVGHSGKILMIPKKKTNNAIWELKKFQSIILGRLLRLKISFVVVKNLGQRGKMFRSFLS